MDAAGEGLRTGRLHGSQTVAQHCGQNLDHLSVAVVGALQLAPHERQAGRQRPILERSVARRSGWEGGDNQDEKPQRRGAAMIVAA